ncbi:Uncharacterized protein GBIM_00207 [Gryllus bimaculatus]|nr:Uncharacterized protein GBIM_00207 [Gryllus bimaculatus]
MSKPKLIVFDLDYTLWPFWVDTHVDRPFRKDKNGVVYDRNGQKVKFYPEVPDVLEKLQTEGYTLAIASRTGEIRGANELVELFGWQKYFQYKEIYPGCKVQHFTEFKKQSGISFEEMMFFDDEQRNINDLSAVGVTAILVPHGVTMKLSLFTINPCQHPIVILKDVKYNDLKIMVDFMYYGEVNVSQEQLPAILKTAEMLKIKGLADTDQHISGTVHMMKSESASSDKADLLTPGDSTWGSDSARRSPSPMSPSMRRKRFRKSSTGSGSGSTERTSEEVTSEMSLAPSLVKPEPVSYTPEAESGGRSDSSLRNSTQEPSTDSEPREGSQDSTEDDPLSMQMSHESSVGVETQIADTGPGPSTSQQSMASQGLQWTLLEHGYPRFALSSCQATLSVQATSAFCTPDPPSNASQPRRDGAQYTSSTYQSHQMLPMSSCAVVGTYSHPSSNPNSPYPTSYTSPCTSPCINPNSINIAGQNAPVRRKRSSNPQADENFVRALEAVRLGGIGFCKAARMFGVNNRTLWLEYKKRGYPVTRPSPSVKSRIKQEVPTSSPSQQANSQPETTPTNAPVSSSSAMCPPPSVGVWVKNPYTFQDVSLRSSVSSWFSPVNFSLPNQSSFTVQPSSPRAKLVETAQGKKLIVCNKEVPVNMLRAIRAVLLQNCSINKAAIMYKVSQSTLWRYVGLLPMCVGEKDLHNFITYDVPMKDEAPSTANSVT